MGEQVRTRRLRENRTMEEVAPRAGVAMKSVQNLERGSHLAPLVVVVCTRPRSFTP